LPNNAKRLGASLGNGECKGEIKNMDLMAAFSLFVRTLPIHFALLGRKRKYIKSQTTAQLKEKRTSIAAVRDILAAIVMGGWNAQRPVRLGNQQKKSEARSATKPTGSDDFIMQKVYLLWLMSVAVSDR
jgi:hypothetical protein